MASLLARLMPLCLQEGLMSRKRYWHGLYSLGDVYCCHVTVDVDDDVVRHGDDESCFLKCVALNLIRELNVDALMSLLWAYWGLHSLEDLWLFLSYC